MTAYHLGSCSCSTGMEYIYDGASSNDNPLRDVIGSYYCTTNSDLCVLDAFGRQWRPAQSDNLITILPAAMCIDKGLLPPWLAPVTECHRAKAVPSRPRLRYVPTADGVSSIQKRRLNHNIRGPPLLRHGRGRPIHSVQQTRLPTNSRVLLHCVFGAIL